MSVDSFNESLFKMIKTYTAINKAMERDPKDLTLQNRVAELAEAMTTFRKEIPLDHAKDREFMANFEALGRDIRSLVKIVFDQNLTPGSSSAASSSEVSPVQEEALALLKQKIPGKTQLILPNLYQIQCLDQNTREHGEVTCGFHCLKNALCALAAYKGYSAGQTVNSFEDENIYQHFEDTICSMRGPSSADDATEINLRETWDAIVDKKVSSFPEDKKGLDWDKNDLSFFHIGVNDSEEGRGITTTDPESLASLANLKELSQRKGPCYHAFIIGDKGHWFTMIYEKDAQNQVTWYGIDSDGNKQDQFIDGCTWINNAMEEIDRISPRLFYDSVGEEIMRKSELIGPGYHLLDEEDKTLFINTNQEGILIPKIRAAVNFLSRMGWLKDFHTPMRAFFIQNLIAVLEYYKQQGIQSVEVEKMLSQTPSIKAGQEALSSTELRIPLLELSLSNTETNKKAIADLRSLTGEKLEYALETIDRLKAIEKDLDTPINLTPLEECIASTINLIKRLPLDLSKEIVNQLNLSIENEKSRNTVDRVMTMWHKPNNIIVFLIMGNINITSRSINTFITEFNVPSLIVDHLISNCWKNIHSESLTKLNGRFAKLQECLSLCVLLPKEFLLENYESIDFRKDIISIKEAINTLLTTNPELLERIVNQIKGQFDKIENPHLARILATSAKDNEVIFRLPFDSNNPVDQKYVDEMLITANYAIALTEPDELLNPNNPYTVMQQHRLIRSTQTPQRVEFSIKNKSNVYDCAQNTPKITLKDIPVGMSLRVLEEIFQGIRHKLQSENPEANAKLEKYILEGKYQESDLPEVRISFDALESNLMKDSYILELFELPKNPNDEVSTTQYKFFVLLKYLSEQSPSVQNGEILSPQEKLLLVYCSTIKACKSGRKQAVDALYQIVPKNDKEIGYAAHDNEEHLKKFTQRFFRTNIETALRDENFIKVILNLSENDPLEQPSHQVDFLRNRFGKLLGLNDAIEFDFHTASCLYGNIHDVTEKQFIFSFWEEGFRMSDLIKNYTNALQMMLSDTIKKPQDEKSDMEKSLYGYLTEILEEQNIPVEEAFLMDEEGFIFEGITEKCAEAVRDHLKVIEPSKCLLKGISLKGKSIEQIMKLIKGSDSVITLDLTNCTDLMEDDILNMIAVCKTKNTIKLNLTGCTQLSDAAMGTISEYEFEMVNLTNCTQLSLLKMNDWRYTMWLIIEGCPNIKGEIPIQTINGTVKAIVSLKTEFSPYWMMEKKQKYIEKHFLDMEPENVSDYLHHFKYSLDEAVDFCITHKLKSVDLSSYINDVGDAEIKKLIDADIEIEKLFTFSKDVSPDVILAFTERHRHLTSLEIGYINIPTATLRKIIANCPNLTSIAFSIDGNNQLKELAKLTKLTSVKLRNPWEALTHRELMKFLASCKKLTSLHLYDSWKNPHLIRAEDVIANCPTITTVNLTRADVSDDFINELKAKGVEVIQ